MTSVDVLDIGGVVNSFAVRSCHHMLHLALTRRQFLRRAMFRCRNAIQMAPAGLLPWKYDLICRRPDQLGFGHNGMPQASRARFGAEHLMRRLLLYIERSNRPGLASPAGHECIDSALRGDPNVSQCVAMGRPDWIGVAIHASVDIT